jgi:hypothetical protein
MFILVPVLAPHIRDEYECPRLVVANAYVIADHCFAR